MNGRNRYVERMKDEDRKRCLEANLIRSSVLDKFRARTDLRHRQKGEGRSDCYTDLSKNQLFRFVTVREHYARSLAVNLARIS
jgi:hypothetical protein